MTGPLPIDRTELFEDQKRFVDEYEAAKRRVRDSYGRLSPEQIRQRTSDKSWCVAECLEHLVITARLYMAVLDNAIPESRVRSYIKRPPYKYGRLTQWFIRKAGEYPVKLKAKTPRKFNPGSYSQLDDPIKAFCEKQDEMIKRVHESNGLDLGRLKSASPITPLIRFSIGQIFQLVLSHQNRHLWQADQAVKSL